jgi:hypothetical protein
MGWLYQDNPVDDPVAELTAHYTYDGDTRTWVALAAARVANTVYIAVQSTDKATGQTYVFAAVILFSNSTKNGFGYKHMDETVGPSQCDCPDRIMRLLTPITDLPNPGYAANWRARVEARKNEKRQQRERRQSLRLGASSRCQTPPTSPAASPPAHSASLISTGRRRFSNRWTARDFAVA